jgi:hypothetical protein
VHFPVSENAGAHRHVAIRDLPPDTWRYLALAVSVKAVDSHVVNA